MNKNKKIVARQQEVSDNTNSSLITESYAQIYSGPLPSPEDLEKYEKILPGLAKELVYMVKKEQDFRHTEISRVNKFEVKSGYLGMFISFLIFIVAVIFSGVLIYLGQSTQAVVSITVTILTFAGLFMNGKNKKEEVKQIEKQ